MASLNNELNMMQKDVMENKSNLDLMKQMVTELGRHITDSNQNLTSEIKGVRMELVKLSEVLMSEVKGVRSEYVSKEMFDYRIKPIEEKLSDQKTSTKGIADKLWNGIWLVVGAVLLAMIQSILK